MSPKRRKIKKVLSLREKALDQRALELAQSREVLDQAKRDHLLESERMLAAATRRRELSSGRVDIGSWIESEQWLRQRQQDLCRADGRVTQANATVSDALQGVVVAQIDKRRIELLDQHLADGELRRENVIEQRLTDELARRRTPSDED